MLHWAFGQTGRIVADFDFDHWCELAAHEPDRYYRERERTISAFIDAHPAGEARRLRDLQAQVDATRALAVSPLRATRALLGMMEDRLGAMRDRLLELQQAAEELARSVDKPPPRQG